MNKIPDMRTLTITDLGFGGDGIARTDDGVIFVPYAVPGDTVRVRIAGQKDRQTWAQVVDVIHPSEDRNPNPPCAHATSCGGCPLQIMAQGAYQEWKYQSVLDRLARAGMVPGTAHPLVTIPPQTRRRATFCARRESGRVILGFNAHHSDRVIDLHECHVVLPQIFALLPGLRLLMDVMLDDVRQADISVTHLDTGLDVLITGEITLNLIKHEALAEFVAAHPVARISLRAHERDEAEILLQPRPAEITLSHVKLTPSAGSFLQPSAEGEAALVAAVQAGVGNARRIADLFSGLGTFTFPLARAADQVWGVDADGPGIRAAVGGIAQAKNVTFTARNLYRDPCTSKELSGFDAVVFDPPRAGAKAQAPEIARAGVSRIVAVSCNPASFITDCAPFMDAGYSFTDLSVVDQFIWSSHVEIVGVFQRGSESVVR